MAVGSNEWLGSALVGVKYMTEAQMRTDLLILISKRSTPAGGAGREAGVLATLPPGAARTRSAMRVPPQSEKQTSLVLMGLALLPSEREQGELRLFSTSVHNER